MMAGCSRSAEKDKEKHDVIFMKDITISYGDRDTDTCRYISRVDSTSVNSSMITDGTLNVGSYTIACPAIDEDADLGEVKLDYVLDGEIYSTTATIVDDTPPAIKTDSRMLEFEEGQVKDLSSYYSVSDNHDDVKDITITVEANGFDGNKAGDYKVYIHAEDTSGNIGTAILYITITPAKKESAPDKSFSSGGNAGGGSGGGGYTPSSPQGGSYVVPACTFASFYESQYGDLISAYNAAMNYYSSCGSASLNPINDAEGNTIGWSVG